jgi:sarcosine oxidase subunit beta
VAVTTTAKQQRQRYSLLSLARQAFGGHEGWGPAWRKAEPKDGYDVVIVGGGGHGLATAYYLAKEHGLTNVAVLERGPLGMGNTGRNTTIVRSNYLWDESARLYEHSLKLWEGLSQDLNFNVMFSQRGVLNLCHNLGDIREAQRRVNALRLNGIDSEYLSTAEVKAFCPVLNTSPTCATPCWAARSSAAPAPRATTRWPGATRGPPPSAASTSSSTAR